MKITKQMLTDKYACSSQIAKFMEVFPSGEVEVTRALCVRHALDFDFEWVGCMLLPPVAVDWFHNAMLLHLVYSREIDKVLGEVGLDRRHYAACLAQARLKEAQRREVALLFWRAVNWCNVFIGPAGTIRDNALVPADMAASLDGLLGWADFLGGFDSDVWRRARASLDRARRAGVTPQRISDPSGS